MGKEEFTVRITKKGEIFIEIETLPPRRIKDLIKYLEETLGPVELVESDIGPGGTQVTLENLLGLEEEEQQQSGKKRIKLRRLDQ